MRFLIILLFCSVYSVMTYPYYQQYYPDQQQPLYYNTPYKIGTGVLPSQSTYNYPYYPYYPYDWNSFNTNFYNPYNN